MLGEGSWMMQMTAKAPCLLSACKPSRSYVGERRHAISAIAQSKHADAVALPAMSMAEALQAIAPRTAETINYDPDAVKGLTYHPVRGAADAQHAVRAATLQGSSPTVMRGAKEALAPRWTIWLTSMAGTWRS